MSSAETVHNGGKQMSSESIVLNSRIDMVCEAVKKTTKDVGK